jgi:tetratricopeptide (TPR) repeat protein
VNVRAIAIAALCAGACGAVPAARAQGTPAPGSRLPGSTVEERQLPMLFSAAPMPDVWRSQRPLPPLPPPLEARVRRAADLRLAGMLAQSLDSLRAIERVLPGHPRLVTEIARTEIALGRPGDAASRLRAMREATRDSVAGSRELAQALEALAKPREAALVAIETWAAWPGEARWAMAEILRLAPLDARPITDAMGRAAERPGRPDLVRGWAVLLGRQGRAAEAVRRLAAAEPAGHAAALRLEFADQMALSGVPADTTAALEALVSAAGDPAAVEGLRTTAAQRALDLARAPGARAAIAPRLAGALSGLPPARWETSLLVALVRELRLGGHAGEAEALLARATPGRGGDPALELERALVVLRQGPPERALPALDSLARTRPEARPLRADALFFAGELDSARAAYARVAEQGEADDAIHALDRAYLLESSPGAPALRTLGAIAYARWRGDAGTARALADSLWGALPPASPCYAEAAMEAWRSRADAGEWREALRPLAAIADSLPDDRLAPLARQRAGEAWLALGDPRQARAQFEECLARYPRAWNSAAVRRMLEPLRKGARL